MLALHHWITQAQVLSRARIFLFILSADIENRYGSKFRSIQISECVYYKTKLYKVTNCCLGTYEIYIGNLGLRFNSWSIYIYIYIIYIYNFFPSVTWINHDWLYFYLRNIYVAVIQFLWNLYLNLKGFSSENIELFCIIRDIITNINININKICNLQRRNAN